jgi:hypothetical protein
VYAVKTPPGQRVACAKRGPTIVFYFEELLALNGGLPAVYTLSSSCSIGISKNPKAIKALGI